MIAFDRLGVDVMAFVEPVVEAHQHLAGAGGVLGLALDLHLGAARGDIDAEPVLDRDQVAVELAEQRTEQVRLLELDLEAGAGTGGLGGDFLLRHQRGRPHQFRAGQAVRAGRQYLDLDEVADRRFGLEMDRLQPGRLADQLAGLAAGPLEQHLGAAADARLVEGELLGVEQRLQPLQPFVHHFAGHLLDPSPPRACRGGRNI